MIVLIKSQMREASLHAACLQGVGERTPLCVVACCHAYASPANSGAARGTRQLHCLFFLLNCNRHAALLSGPVNDKTIGAPTYLQMPLPGIIQPVLCKAFDNCSEFDKETLSNARAKFQSTWPKYFRIEDLWLHAYRSARPVEKSPTTPHAQE